MGEEEKGLLSGLAIRRSLEQASGHGAMHGMTLASPFGLASDDELSAVCGAATAAGTLPLTSQDALAVPMQLSPWQEAGR